MFCTKCGAKVDADSKFCNNCGKQIEEAQKSEVKDGKELTLTDYASQKLEVIKIIRDATGLGLKEAKDLVESTPRIISYNDLRCSAKDFIKKLEAAGAVLEYEIPMEIPDEVAPVPVADVSLDISNSVKNQNNTIDFYEKKELRDILVQVSKTLKNKAKDDELLQAAIAKKNQFEATVNKIKSNINNYESKITEELLLRDDFERFKNENKENIRIYEKTMTAFAILFLLGAVVLIGFILMGLFPVGLIAGGILIGISLIKYNSKAAKTSANAVNNELLKITDELYLDFEKKINEANHTANSYIPVLSSPPVSLIPTDYRSADILLAMLQYLENMEASTWKECVAVYKEDKHRQEMIAQQEEFERKRLEEMENNNGVKCPKCNSSNLQYASETKTSGGGYGFGSGCCGAILLGPIGLLCGMCGRSVSSETKTYWVCKNCGNKFHA